METWDAIRSVVENIPGICQLKPEQEECLVHILNGGDILALLPTGFGKMLIYQSLPIVSKKQVSLSFLFQSLTLPCHAVILQLSYSISDRFEMNEELTVGCNYFLVCLNCQILV